MHSGYWILLGMMGAGKSSVGRALAELSERPFVDTDLMIQTRLGRPIPQLFQIYGEDAFRDHETSILRMLEPEAGVLSTGGGIVIRAENWTEMRRLGKTVYLRSTPDSIIARLETSKKRRPLLETENWQDRVKQLLEVRAPLYEQADLTVELDGLGVEEAAKCLLEVLQA